MQNVKIIEDFYSEKDYGLIQHFLHTNNMKAVHQPNRIYYPNRLQAYPCWETDRFSEDSFEFNIFKKTFELKSGMEINNINSFFRTVKKCELEQSPYVGKEESLIHQDTNTESDISHAGVIYFDSFSIKDGTRLYSYKSQIEPDIIIGSKPNRCIFYKSNIFHSAGIDWRQDKRTVQIFFFTTVNRSS